MKPSARRSIQNVAIVFLFLIGVKNIIVSLPFSIQLFNGFSHIFDKYIFGGLGFYATRTTLNFITGILMVFLVYRLYRRVRMAWVIEVAVLVISIILQIIRWHIFWVPLIVIECIILVVLLMGRKDFSRRGNKITLKWALILILSSFVLVILNGTLRLLQLHQGHYEPQEIWNSFVQSLQLLFFMDTTGIPFEPNKINFVYMLIGLNWLFILAAVFLVLKPLIIKPASEVGNMEKIKRYIRDYGQNPMSYLALEKDKEYYLGQKVKGVAAFTVVGKVMVLCGDIICDSKDGEAFLTELEHFSSQNGWQILMLNVTDYFLELYKSHDFGAVKCGEDACIYLPNYTLAGGKVAKIRTAVNRATREGVIVQEYKPTEHKDANLEASFDSITADWLSGKNIAEMSFMLGGPSLEDPLDRRYFYATDGTGEALGFVVLLPFQQKTAYLVDVTRYRKNAPHGVLETIINYAFMTLKDEGVLWGSLGLSPLYNVGEEDKAVMTEKLFSFIYTHLNNAYGFKPLHTAKEKYGPSDWQSRYIVYLPKPFTPQYAYAVIKAQNPAGITKVILSELKKSKPASEMKQPTENEGHIQSADADIYYTSKGQGKPLIMLHGYGQSGRYFHRQVEFFQKYYRVITIDSRGQGQSSHGYQRLTLSLMAQDVVAVVKALNLDSVLVLGFSDGGNIAMHLALNNPEIIKGLVLVGSNTHAVGVKKFVRVPAFLGQKACGALGAIPWFYKKAQLLSLVIDEPQIEYDQLATVQIPTLVMAGASDVIYKEHTQSIHEALPNSHIRIIEKSGHLLLSSHYQEANQTILEFLQSLK